jgi:cytochrome P450
MRAERRHFSFSFGSHFCLGQAVARVNIRESLLAFLSRCRDLELLSQPERVPFVPDEQLRDLRVGFNSCAR